MFKLIRVKWLEKYVIALALVVAIGGCGSTNKPTKQNKVNIELGTVTHNAQHYLGLASVANKPHKSSYLLLAARAYIKQNNLMAAQQILKRLIPLGDDQTLEHQLLTSELYLLTADYQQALTSLTENSSWQLPAERWQQFYRQKSILQQHLEQPLAAAISQISLSNYLVDYQIITLNHQQIWQLLSSLPQDELADAQSNINHFNGWQALVINAKSAAMSPNELSQVLDQWRLNYPSHPAVNKLPKSLNKALNITPYSPQKIAILLPLTGRYQRLGKVIQNGIISNLLSHELAPELIIIDTEKGAQSAFEQAQAAGAQFIIGPLLKKNVAIVSQIQSETPILFLNQAPDLTLDSMPQNGHYYFSLDKESEAIQGSEYIFNSGKKSPAIIAPNNANGHKIAKLFNQRWQQLNQNNEQKTTVETFFFNNDKELKLTVERLFETNKSQVRINQLRLMVGSKMKSKTRSRRDIDAIYLVANPRQTSMLKPSIDVTVSEFADQVATYVGSTGNEHLKRKRSTNDLNLLHVSELPWLLQLRDNKLNPQSIKKLWPKLKQNQLRLFAMGYDAYQLVNYLAQMEYFPQFKLEGFSGLLSLAPNHKIIRQLSWAQYQRGRLVPQG